MKPPGSRTRARCPSAASMRRTAPGHRSAGGRCVPGALAGVAGQGHARIVCQGLAAGLHRGGVWRYATLGSVIVLLSTSDTDLLSARASGAGYRLGNPARVLAGDLPALLDGASVVVVRILGGRRAWEEGLDAVLRLRRARGRARRRAGPGRRADGAVDRAGRGRRRGARLPRARRPGEPAAARPVPVRRGPADRRTGSTRPPPMPTWGLLDRPASAASTLPASTLPAGRAGSRARPTVAILYYRAHHVAGNTGFVHALADAIEAAGGRALPVFCSSLRTAPSRADRRAARGRRDRRHRPRGGGLVPAAASAGGADEEWDVGALAEPGRADPAGPVPDHLPRAVGGQRRGPDPAGRGDPGRDPRVRRPADHRPVLVQGGRDRTA